MHQVSKRSGEWVAAELYAYLSQWALLRGVRRPDHRQNLVWASLVLCLLLLFVVREAAPRYFHPIADALSHEPWVRSVKAFPTAFVPIIKVAVLPEPGADSSRRNIRLDITFQTASHRCVGWALGCCWERVRG
jgi:hypothetical protein